MKRLFIGLGLLEAILVVSPAAQADDVNVDVVACVPWSGNGHLCHDRTVPVPPGVDLGSNPTNRPGGVSTTVRVLLPADYHHGPKRSYPVLYLLHGAGDSYRTWTERTDIIDFVLSPQNGLRDCLIIVMPDGGCQLSSVKPECTGAGWYSDWVDGSRRWETFHIDVLVPWVDANYRTGHRAVAGLSMGGFGSMKYAARHPGTFHAAASFSGLLDIMYGAPATGLLYDEFSGTISDNVWGDQVTGAPTWLEHNPATLGGAPHYKLNDVALFVTSGTGEPTTGTPPFDVGENLIFQTNLSFVQALATAGRVPELDGVAGPGSVYRTNFYPLGRHAWPYWEAALHWALPQIIDVIDYTAQDLDGDGLVGCADNCPFVSNPGQEDAGGDGIGNACQCGDVTGNGLVNGQDGILITRYGLGYTDPILVPGNCDVTGNGLCNGQDGFFTTRAGLGFLDPFDLAPRGQNCPNANPLVPCPYCP